MKPLIIHVLYEIRNLTVQIIDKIVLKIEKPKPFHSLPFPELPYDGTPNGGGWHLSDPAYIHAGFSETATYPYTRPFTSSG